MRDIVKLQQFLVLLWEEGLEIVRLYENYPFVSHTHTQSGKETYLRFWFLQFQRGHTVAGWS